MTLNQFKEEYTKKEVFIKNIKFTINKIPAFKAAFIFSGLTKKLFGDIATLDLGDNNGEAIKSIIFGLIGGLDVDYLENELTPILFKNIVYSSEKDNIHNMELHAGILSVQCHLDFDDIIELILRSLAVNFLNATSARLSKLLAAK
jgi:hypothetical protein